MSSFISTKSSVRNMTKPTNIFYVWYAELCRRLNTSPLSVVKPPKVRSKTVLDFVCDRIRPEEWKPLLNALEKDTSLHVIAIRSRMQYQFLHDIDSLEKVLRMKRKFGAICTSHILSAVLKSLCRTIRESQVLSCVELEGLPITLEYMHPLLTSLTKNNTLKIVSLPYCPIRDEGCRQLCLALKFQPNIEVVNLSGCGLTAESGEYIANVIKFQRIDRYCECWHHSLRYKEPDIEHMRGLKRITLNNNPNIGDTGLTYILEELEDDLWIRAIDMQKCGITENMAQRIIDLVQYSRYLEVVDFRGNDKLSAKTIETILELINQKQPLGYQAEYKWCLTATSNRFENYSMRSSTTNNYSGIQKSRSVPFGRVTSPKNSLRRIATTTNIKKRPTERNQYEKKTMQQAKIDIIELNKKLQEETAKREEAQQKNKILMEKLQAIKSVGCMEGTNKKTIIPQQGKATKKRKTVLPPTENKSAQSILENLLYSDGVVEDDMDAKSYFEDNLKSTKEISQEDAFRPETGRQRTKVTAPKTNKNGIWHPGVAASKTMIKVR